MDSEYANSTSKVGKYSLRKDIADSTKSLECFWFHSQCVMFLPNWCSIKVEFKGSEIEILPNSNSETRVVC